MRPIYNTMPRKDEKVNQCCFNVGPTSKIAANIRTTLVHCLAFAGCAGRTEAGGGGGVAGNSPAYPKNALYCWVKKAMLHLVCT